MKVRVKIIAENNYTLLEMYINDFLKNHEVLDIHYDVPGVVFIHYIEEEEQDESNGSIRCPFKSEDT